MRGMRAQFLLGALLSVFAFALPAAAQQTGQDTTKTREERIRDP
jgi:hypothetical protein